MPRKITEFEAICKQIVNKAASGNMSTIKLLLPHLIEIADRQEKEQVDMGDGHARLARMLGLDWPPKNESPKKEAAGNGGAVYRESIGRAKTSSRRKTQTSEKILIGEIHPPTQHNSKLWSGILRTRCSRTLYSLCLSCSFAGQPFKAEMPQHHEATICAGR